MRKKITALLIVIISFFAFVGVAKKIHVQKLTNIGLAAQSTDDYDESEFNLSRSSIDKTEFYGDSLIDVEYGNDPRQKMDIYRPTDSITSSEPYPAIIVIHGGGWRVDTGGTRQGMTPLSKAFANLGYVVFNISYGLVPDAIYPAQMDDVQLAVRWIRANAEEYNIDPDRLGSYGGSAGGHLSALLATAETRDTSLPYSEYSSKVNCAINSTGPTNFIQLHYLYVTKGMTGWRLRMVEELFGGTPGEKNKDYIQMSPAYQIFQTEPAPILTLHGSGDITIPIEDTDLFDKIFKAKFPDNPLGHLYFRYHNEIGHQIYLDSTDSQKKVIENASKAVYTFFDKHLSNSEKNHAPLFYPLPDRVIKFGSTTKINIRTVDLDGDDVEIAAENIPTGSKLTQNEDNSATFEWTPANENCDYADMTFKASDGELSTTVPLKIELDSKSQPLHRLWNGKITDHFYTISEEGKNNLIESGWTYEGVAGYLHGAKTPTTEPVYRLYKSQIGDHYYTTSEKQRDAAVGIGYVYEGIAGYIHKDQTLDSLPFYHFRSDTLKDNFYTANEAGKEALMSKDVYKYIDIAGYIDTKEGGVCK